MREAKNAKAFGDWVRSATGWKIEVITGLEEGRLIHLGVMAGTRLTARRVLLIDLGGGSCELTFSVGGQIQEMASLPLGAVRLTEEFLAHDPAEAEGAAAPPRLHRRRGGAHRAPGAGEARAGHDRDRRHGRDARGPRVQAHAGAASRAVARWRRRRRSAASPTRSRVTISRNDASSPASVRVVPRSSSPAPAVYAGLMVQGISGFRYSPLGVRDGLLAQMAADLGGERTSSSASNRSGSVALVTHGTHYGVDASYAKTVRDLAASLFVRLKTVHQLPAEYEEWLTAAAMLQEIGSFVNRGGRHRHAYYLIANSEIFGYTTEQRRIIATIARYVGNSRPTPDDRPIRALGGNDRELVPKAVMLLRLARALNQSRNGIVRSVARACRAGG